MRTHIAILGTALLALGLPACWCPDCGECGIAGPAGSDYANVNTLGYDGEGRPAALVVMLAEGTCQGNPTETRRVVELADGTIDLQEPAAYAGEITPSFTRTEDGFAMTDRDWSVRQRVGDFGAGELTVFAGPEGMQVQVDCLAADAALSCALAE